MNSLDLNEVTQFVDANIGTFHENKLKSIKGLKLDKLLRRKNPYLFKAKNVRTSEEFIKNVVDAHLSSQEETMFGIFLESLAQFVCKKIFGGHKTPGEDLDLDFSRDGIRYLVSIKSGPNWGNSQQIKKMKENFKKAKIIIGSQNIVCVNGCCYGRNRNENRGDYIKKCGQSFWDFITGDSEFYKKIIEPLGHKAKERNEEFMNEYSMLLNRFSKQFMDNFCKENGQIDWEKLVEFNSGKTVMKLTKMMP
ncbi:MAG: hypothetical protein A4E35_01460 [Methanoregula sp. PtaU1.Bin051]|nr:MAG: hypothetical protein A4E35_01460 [Methanoregula sp. PtaU1.Bin051]